MIALLLKLCYWLHRLQYRKDSELTQTISFIRRCAWFGFERLPLKSPSEMEPNILNACSSVLDIDLHLTRALRHADGKEEKVNNSITTLPPTQYNPIGYIVMIRYRQSNHAFRFSSKIYKTEQIAKEAIAHAQRDDGYLGSYKFKGEWTFVILPVYLKEYPNDRYAIDYRCSC